MKDSGIEWIGEIPEEWEISPLFSIFKERKQKNYNLKETNILSLSYGKIIRRNTETNMGLLPESFETYNIVDKRMSGINFGQTSFFQRIQDRAR